MEQMSDTLKSLNGIFKAMQADGSAARTADLVSHKHSLSLITHPLDITPHTPDMPSMARPLAPPIWSVINTPSHLLHTLTHT